MLWPNGHMIWYGIWYGLAGMTWSMVMSWLIMVMVYDMTWWAMTWYIVWPGRQGMIYGVALHTWHCTKYGLAGITLYILWPYGNGIFYGLAGMAWYVVWRE